MKIRAVAAVLFHAGGYAFLQFFKRALKKTKNRAQIRAPRFLPLRNTLLTYRSLLSLARSPRNFVAQRTRRPKNKPPRCDTQTCAHFILNTEVQLDGDHTVYQKTQSPELTPNPSFPVYIFTPQV